MDVPVVWSQPGSMLSYHPQAPSQSTAFLWANVAQGTSVEWQATLATTNTAVTPKIQNPSPGSGNYAVEIYAENAPAPPTVTVQGTYLTTMPQFTSINANGFSQCGKIETMTKANRKIGLGVMGWANLLFKLAIPYNSNIAIELAEQVMQVIDSESKIASAGLAEVRGPFPNFKGSIYDQKDGLKLRNATTTTIAPTGTISIICDSSSGIEPLFSLAFVREIMDQDRLIEINRTFELIAQSEGFYNKELVELIATNPHLAFYEMMPEKWRAIFVTAHDIDPEWHIRMQAAFQKYTDNAVSKTINFPKGALPDQIADAYRLAYKLGCKGLTVYRDGSIEHQPMQTITSFTGTAGSAGDAGSTGDDGSGLEQKAQTGEPVVESSRLSQGKWGKLSPVKRPRSLTGITEGRQSPEGNLYLTMNFHDNQPFELFAQIGKAGSDISAFTEAIARLISLAFRCGVDPEAVADELIGIGGSRMVGFGPNRVRSVPDAIGQFIIEQLRKTEASWVPEVESQLELGLKEAASVSPKGKGKIRYNLCPECGMHTFGYIEGCAKCLACGYSEC